MPTADTRDFIKRIVALPGETIQIENGQVYVCDEPDCVPLGPRRTTEGRTADRLPEHGRRGPACRTRTTFLRSPCPTTSTTSWATTARTHPTAGTSAAIDREKIIGKAFVLVWPPTGSAACSEAARKQRSRARRRRKPAPNRAARRPAGRLEEILSRKGFRFVAGVDEVGRGALAGPLVTAAVMLDIAARPGGPVRLEDAHRRGA